jgi:hypothetical protein
MYISKLPFFMSKDRYDHNHLLGREVPQPQHVMHGKVIGPAVLRLGGERVVRSEQARAMALETTLRVQGKGTIRVERVDLARDASIQPGEYERLGVARPDEIAGVVVGLDPEAITDDKLHLYAVEGKAGSHAPVYAAAKLPTTEPHFFTITHGGYAQDTAIQYTLFSNHHRAAITVQFREPAEDDERFAEVRDSVRGAFVERFAQEASIIAVKEVVIKEDHMGLPPSNTCTLYGMHLLPGEQ